MKFCYRNNCTDLLDPDFQKICLEATQRIAHCALRHRHPGALLGYGISNLVYPSVEWIVREEIDDADYLIVIQPKGVHHRWLMKEVGLSLYEANEATGVKQ